LETIGAFLLKSIELTSSEIALYRVFFGSMFLLLYWLSKKKRLSWGNSKENAAYPIYSGTAIV